MQVLIYAKVPFSQITIPGKITSSTGHKDWPLGLDQLISPKTKGYFSSGYLCNIMIYKVYVLECGRYIHIHNILYIYSIGDIYRILQYKTSSKQIHSTKSTGSTGASSTTAPDLAPPLTDDAEEPPVAAILKLQLPHVADIQEWYVWVKLRLSPTQVHTRLDFFCPSKLSIKVLTLSQNISVHTFTSLWDRVEFPNVKLSHQPTPSGQGFGHGNSEKIPHEF